MVKRFFRDYCGGWIANYNLQEICPARTIRKSYKEEDWKNNGKFFKQICAKDLMNSGER